MEAENNRKKIKIKIKKKIGAMPPKSPPKIPFTLENTTAIENDITLVPFNSEPELKNDYSINSEDKFDNTAAVDIALPMPPQNIKSAEEKNKTNIENKNKEDTAYKMNIFDKIKQQREFLKNKFKVEENQTPIEDAFNKENINQENNLDLTVPGFVINKPEEKEKPIPSKNTIDETVNVNYSEIIPFEEEFNPEKTEEVKFQPPIINDDEGSLFKKTSTIDDVKPEILQKTSLKNENENEDEIAKRKKDFFKTEEEFEVDTETNNDTNTNIDKDIEEFNDNPSPLYVKNFAADLNLSPFFISTKFFVFAFAFALILGAIIGNPFSDKNSIFNAPKEKVIQVSGVVKNPAIPKNTKRCGLNKDNEPCYIYIMNALKKEVKVTELFPLIKTITGIEEFMFKPYNVEYANNFIKAGYLAEFYIVP